MQSFDWGATSRALAGIAIVAAASCNPAVEVESYLQVIDIEPTNGSIEVADDVKVVAVFSEALVEDSVTGDHAWLVRAMDGSGVEATVSLSGSDHGLTLTPTQSLLPGESYTFVLQGIQGEASGKLKSRVETTFTVAEPYSPPDPDDDPDPEVDPGGVLAILEALDGVGVLELGCDNADARCFDLLFDQPVDHADPKGATFSQWTTLVYRSWSAPLVLVTEGSYMTLTTTEQELTTLLDANQLVIEHRYYGYSIPEDVDWSTLTTDQAAADVHDVVQKLQPLFSGPFVGTGEGKGGSAAVFHRRHFPDDVDATVAYAAPLSFQGRDPRYSAFLATSGEDCADRLRALQREMLSRRDALVPLVDAYGVSGDKDYDYCSGAEFVFEENVLTSAWNFWRDMGVAYCGYVPDPETATDDDLFEFLLDMGGLEGFDDSRGAIMGPYNYQVLKELGYPDYGAGNLGGLLVGSGTCPLAAWLPEGEGVPTFDSTSMADVDAWVQSEGERLLLVYGEHDPWTGGAFELGAAADSYEFIVSAGTHEVSISQLGYSDQQAVYGLLEDWTGVTPE